MALPSKVNGDINPQMHQEENGNPFVCRIPKLLSIVKINSTVKINSGPKPPQHNIPPKGSNALIPNRKVGVCADESKVHVNTNKNNAAKNQESMDTKNPVRRLYSKDISSLSGGVTNAVLIAKIPKQATKCGPATKQAVTLEKERPQNVTVQLADFVKKTSLQNVEANRGPTVKREFVQKKAMPRNVEPKCRPTVNREVVKIQTTLNVETICGPTVKRGVVQKKDNSQNVEPNCGPTVKRAVVQKETSSQNVEPKRRPTAKQGAVKRKQTPEKYAAKRKWQPKAEPVFVPTAYQYSDCELVPPEVNSTPIFKAPHIGKRPPLTGDDFFKWNPAKLNSRELFDTTLFWKGF